jgi:hypothetical protein
MEKKGVRVELQRRSGEKFRLVRRVVVYDSVKAVFDKRNVKIDEQS